MSRGLGCLLAIALVVAPAAAQGDGAGGAVGAGATEAEARLAATLTGADESMALIALGGSQAGGSQAWLRPGDRLDSCVLRRVDAGGAELECVDRRLRLRLDGAATSGQRSVSPPGHVVVPPGWIESLAARPQGIAQGLDLAPEADVAGLRGWRVTRLDPASPLSLLGIQEQDLVLGVAGFPASEAASFVAGLRSLPELGSFNVTLQRDGRVIDLAIVAPRADPSP